MHKINEIRLTTMHMAYGRCSGKFKFLALAKFVSIGQ